MKVLGFAAWVVLVFVCLVQTWFLVSMSNRIVYLGNKLTEHQLKESFSKIALDKNWLMKNWGSGIIQLDQSVIVEYEIFNLNAFYDFTKNNFNGLLFILNEKDEVIDVDFYKS